MPLHKVAKALQVTPAAVRWATAPAPQGKPEPRQEAVQKPTETSQEGDWLDQLLGPL